MGDSVTDKQEIKTELNPHLYSLIGGTPPIAFVKPTHLPKWNTKKKAESWVQRPFLHPARTDTLVLHHWTKEPDQDMDDYHFAKFNRVIDIVDYTEEDYDKYLTDTDWTKEETDYLFRLCRMYDLRFPVIADRYNYDTSRTLEDLKDRYYTINRKLIKARGGLSNDHPPSMDRQTLLQQYSYDKNKETERKQALIRLYQRSREQIQEEEILFMEAKRMEENQHVFTTQRDQLYSTLHLEQAQQMPSTPLTPLSSSSTSTHLPLPSGPTSANSTLSSTSSSHLPSPSSTTNSTPLSVPGGIGITGGTSSAAQDQKKKKKEDTIKKARRISTSSSMEDLLPPPPEKKDKLIPGVYVRSQKLPGVKTNLQPKVLRTMAEFGIGARPVMPTQEVCYKYEYLQNSVVALLELKKMAEKLDIDTKVKGSTTVTGRKHSLSSGSSSTANRPGGDRRRKLG
ncbi:uncharacterized protein BX664DRAFT_358512 [Halteromyces radiatus]|uniref:uncharacterized protein n=1 Tax=Halteromyces radiatus TaxID=101107 RepID=UPI0022205F26|nr:uncharacterized protein BX664DRAFT_358512 [Halteromyces radiatus]KAI8088883.1 hypothetical protein BX664DRAFT_358512 [Halteromyces radiatus]